MSVPFVRSPEEFDYPLIRVRPRDFEAQAFSFKYLVGLTPLYYTIHDGAVFIVPKLLPGWTFHR